MQGQPDGETAFVLPYKPIQWTRELLLTRVAIVITAVCTVLFFFQAFTEKFSGLSRGAIIEQSVFLFFCVFMLYGSYVYQFSRLGYLQRGRSHKRASEEEMEEVLQENALPPAVYLIPSYKEDERVIWQTLVSAALQEYGNRRIVLLIDDPPSPSDPSAKKSLETSRGLPRRLTQIFAPHAAKNKRLAEAFAKRAHRGSVNLRKEAKTLSRAYAQAAECVESLGKEYGISDHTDRLFWDQVVQACGRAHWRAARRWNSSENNIEFDDVARAYRHLAEIFAVEIVSFERKLYVNLSHEPNKAMNLNSYIGLLGNYYAEISDAQGKHLVPVSPKEATLHVPNADYVVTIDADTLLLPGYTRRLIHLMEKPDGKRIAVAQTPYNAVPHSDRIVERVAGATTDIQYILHQGFTHFNATYWVGANAVLRKKALDDIRVVSQERGFEVKRYIQDRTVIEDTESTIDLVHKGWSLYNYPERLSYSATPPDFGSLLIQRRRWANGGLLILSKLFRHLRDSFRTPGVVGEAFMRFHYLSSIALVNVGYLALLFYPFENPLHTVWLPLAVIPYFYLYGRDLVQSGYRWVDLPRVYALNLLLIPIHLGGVFKSLYQGITGKHFAFGRTPKVQNRTAAPFLYVFLEMFFLGWFAMAAIFDVSAGRYVHAVCAIVNGAFFAYAIHAFVGFQNGVGDLLLGMGEWLIDRGKGLLVVARDMVESPVEEEETPPVRVRPPQVANYVDVSPLHVADDTITDVVVDVAIVRPTRLDETMQITFVD